MTGLEIEYLKAHRNHMKDTATRDALDKAIVLCEKMTFDQTEHGKTADLSGLTTQMRECLVHAYNKGYSAGELVTKTSLYDEHDVQTSYAKGCEDTWENIKKIISPTDLGGYNKDELKEMFTYTNIYDIVEHYSAEEVDGRICRHEEFKKLEQCSTNEPTGQQFLEFLYNQINPNEMEKYISMYKSQGNPIVNSEETQDKV